MSSLFAPLVNFAILVGFLAVKLKQPIRDFVSNRHHSLRKEIQTVHEQLKNAQEKYDEFSAKLNAIDAEVSILREQAQQDALAIQQKLVAEAQRMASLIISDARNSAQNLYNELRGQLYFEFSSQVLQKAEKVLLSRLTEEDRIRIRRDFTREMEGASSYEKKVPVQVEDIS